MEREASTLSSTYCIPSGVHPEKCYELFSKISSDERSELWLAKRINRASAFIPKNPLGKRDGQTYQDRNLELFHVKKYIFSPQNAIFSSDS